MGLLVRRCVVVTAALAGLSAGAVRLEAQSATAPELTAAFLFNFVKFTTWPADVLPGASPIVVCVSGDDWVADSLLQLTRNKAVAGHPLAVRRTNLDRPLDECHVVYAAALDTARAQQLLRAATGRSILTVTDSSDFARRGGVANFFMEGDRMRFAVNPAAADRARLRISSNLLTLAMVVRDDLRP
jgi:hypothetical protein